MSDANSDAPDANDGTGDDDIIRLGDGAGGSSGPSGFIDPASAAGGSDSGVRDGGPRKRGRKPGGKNKPRAPKNAPSDLDSFFATCIFGIHQIAASVAKAPELELDDEESARIAKHARAVLSQYTSIDVSPRAQAWVGLIVACGGVYGPRLVAHKIRREHEREARQHRQPAPPPRPAAVMPQQPVKPAPSPESSVVHFPMAPAGGSDFGGGGGPGVA